MAVVALTIENATHIHSGKVRDLYELADGNLLMVASDRISAYDFVLEPGIPDKGEVLTRMSLWWFDQLTDLVPHHLVSTDVPDEVRGRATVVERLEMFPVECVARGYLTGSGLKEYEQSGTVCGIPLPSGLRDGDRLDEPIFTPTTKAPVGEHDEAMTYADVVESVGDDMAARLRDLTLEAYARGESIARKRGIILADTKFEFGARPDGTVVLGDEVLTPDSSRFWPADQYEPGKPQPSFDKQYVRDYSDSVGWDHTPPGPELPDEVVQNTRAKYVEAYERITEKSLD